MSVRVGIDIGGTFTDVVVHDGKTGKLLVGKYLTTPKDPSVSALNGLHDMLNRAGTDLSHVTQLLHATTIASNTVIERTVEEGVGLIITKGFGDYMQIGRQRKPDLYDLSLAKAKPLLPRDFIFEINERIDFDGSIVKPLQEEEIRQIARELVKRKVNSVGVCLIFSFINPEHERLVGRIIKEEAPGIRVSLSCDVCPVWREHERMNTTAANAYIAGAVSSYLERMKSGLISGGYSGMLYMLQSNGGLTAGEALFKRPIWLLESGPAGGAMAASFFGRLMKQGNLLSFDMGGTTAKGCMIIDYKPTMRSEIEVDRHAMRPASGLTLSIPSIDMIEIGAGGGSIAQTSLGVIKVGPRSASADPGPICYSNGGTEVTVTDADLVLGYLSPDYFLGGEMKLDRDAALKGIQEKIAIPLGISVSEAAWGIHHTVNTNMELALRVISLERGYDPKDCTFIGSGGAGPVHGARLAKALGIPQAVFPPAAGVASAMGLLVSEARFDFGHTKMIEINDEISTEAVDAINQLYDEMAAEGINMVKETKLSTSATMTKSVDMRYRGQGYDVPVTILERELTAGDGVLLKKLFNERYLKEYGYTNTDQRCEAVTWRLSCSAGLPDVKIQELKNSVATVSDAMKGMRKVYFPEYKDYIDCDVYDRYMLPPGAVITGPAVVEERESTAVILPGHTGQVDKWGNLVISLKEWEGDLRL